MGYSSSGSLRKDEINGLRSQMARWRKISKVSYLSTFLLFGVKAALAADDVDGMREAPTIASEDGM